MDNGASSYRRFLDGDETALTEIVSQYRPGLQNYIYSVVNDYAAAEDLTEDTFVKLLLKSLYSFYFYLPLFTQFTEVNSFFH